MFLKLLQIEVCVIQLNINLFECFGNILIGLVDNFIVHFSVDFIGGEDIF